MRCDTSHYVSLIQSAIAYLKDIPDAILATKKEWEALNNIKQSSSQKHTVKNRELKPVSHNFFSDDMGLAQKQNMSPNKNIEAKPTRFTSNYHTTPTPPIHQSEVINKPVKELPIEKIPDRSPPSHQSPLKKDDAKIRTNDIKNFLQRHSIHLSEHIPDDAQAVRIMSAYKEYIGNVDVVIFACDADAETLLLIKNLSKSIDQKLAPIKILRPDRLEREQRWGLFIAKNPIKLIIATSEFSKLKAAMRHYTHSDDKSYGFLEGIPLIILSSCAVYTESPKEKSILWNQICTLLKR